MRISVFGVLALGLLTASCGSTPTQRSATGGLTGIGAGAAIGGPIGAVVGGVVGAAGATALPEGADTMAERALNLERGSAQSALNRAGLGAPAASGSSIPPGQAAAPANVKDAQRELKREGLYHGKIDGIAGPQTRQAVTAFQQREGLQQTATLDAPTTDKLKSMRTSKAANIGAAATQGELSPSEVRQRLSQAGYTNVADLRRQSDETWTAQAQRGDQTMELSVDAKTGRVTHEQNVAAAPPSASSGTSTDAAPAANAPTSPGNAAPSGTPPTPSR